MEHSDSAVKVAVRVRPFSKREIEMHTELIIQMQDTQTVLRNVKRDDPDKVFNFDHSFWSMNPSDPHFANQEQVFSSLGTGVLDNAFDGYNACIFAYGQTGSGKTHTMTGTADDRGLIPRLCEKLFERIVQLSDKVNSFNVEVSYMEIYNERVQDLLSDETKRRTLRVREHAILGPYVEGLSRLAVRSPVDIETLMVEGNKARHTAATLMNEQSSRSHAVFTLFFTHSHYDDATKTTGEKVSRISLVDLAGSERHSKTGTTGARLQEGANINKSLTTLGLVISALADQCLLPSSSGDPKLKGKHVPYRDSVLTFLLKDNLGGNSKTVMVATISPAADNYEETLSTLRYADRAKRIVNHAIVNEDPNAKLIRELREELDRLRSEVGSHAPGGSTEELEQLRAKLKETEGFIHEMSMSWEEKLLATQRVLEEKQMILDQHGASVQSQGDRTLRLESKLPHFIGLSDDMLASEVTIFTFKEGMTRIGHDGVDPPQDIVISGPGTVPQHCIIDYNVAFNEDERCLIEVVELMPIGEHCYVGEEAVSVPTRLYHGQIVILGENNVFRFNHPTEAQRLRKQREQTNSTSAPMTMGLAFNPAKLREEKRKEEERRIEAARLALEERERLLAEEKSKREEETARLESLRKQEEKRAKEENEMLRLKLLQMEEMVKAERERSQKERELVAQQEMERQNVLKQYQDELERVNKERQEKEAAERQTFEELEKTKQTLSSLEFDKQRSIDRVLQLQKEMEERDNQFHQIKNQTERELAEKDFLLRQKETEAEIEKTKRADAERVAREAEVKANLDSLKSKQEIERLATEREKERELALLEQRKLQQDSAQEMEKLKMANQEQFSKQQEELDRQKKKAEEDMALQQRMFELAQLEQQKMMDSFNAQKNAKNGETAANKPKFPVTSNSSSTSSLNTSTTAPSQPTSSPKSSPQPSPATKGRKLPDVKVPMKLKQQATLEERQLQLEELRRKDAFETALESETTKNEKDAVFKTLVEATSGNKPIAAQAKGSPRSLLKTNKNLFVEEDTRTAVSSEFGFESVEYGDAPPNPPEPQSCSNVFESSTDEDNVDVFLEAAGGPFSSPSTNHKAISSSPKTSHRIASSPGVTYFTSAGNKDSDKVNSKTTTTTKSSSSVPDGPLFSFVPAPSPVITKQQPRVVHAFSTGTPPTPHKDSPKPSNNIFLDNASTDSPKRPAPLVSTPSNPTIRSSSLLDPNAKHNPFFEASSNAGPPIFYSPKKMTSSAPNPPVSTLPSTNHSVPSPFFTPSQPTSSTPFFSPQTNPPTASSNATPITTTNSTLVNSSSNGHTTNAPNPFLDLIQPQPNNEEMFASPDFARSASLNRYPSNSSVNSGPKLVNPNLPLSSNMPEPPPRQRHTVSTPRQSSAPQMQNAKWENPQDALIADAAMRAKRAQEEWDEKKQKQQKSNEKLTKMLGGLEAEQEKKSSNPLTKLTSRFSSKTKIKEEN